MLQMLKEIVETKDCGCNDQKLEITYTDCSMTIDNSIARMNASMNASMGADRVSVTIHLQRKHGDDWVTDTKWAQDFIGQYGSIIKQHKVDEAHEYKLMTEYCAYIANDSDNFEMKVNDNCC